MKCEGFACEETASDGVKVIGCDTVYAVNREHFSQSWIEIDGTHKLLEILNHYNLPHKVDIVLTGGEPLIYANEPIFIEFLELIHANGHKITFETNGSLFVDFLKYPIYKEAIYALSIKLSNSKEPFNKRVRGNVINSIATNAKETFFKFSIDAKSITSELQNEISEITKFAPETLVYCMPLGATKKEVEENTEPLIEFCKEKGYCFSDRLHIRVWNQNKGV